MSRRLTTPHNATLHRRANRGLADILQAPVYNRVHCDGQGQARVFEKNTPPERILSLGFDPLRQATKNSVELTVRVLDAIGSLAPFLNTPISPWS